MRRRPMAVRVFARLARMLLPEQLTDSHGEALVEAFWDLYVGAREELAARLRALPGVTHVSYASQLPMLDGDWSRDFDVVDQPRERSQWPSSEIRFVGPGYFQAMGVQIMHGRE